MCYKIVMKEFIQWLASPSGEPLATGQLAHLHLVGDGVARTMRDGGFPREGEAAVGHAADDGAVHQWNRGSRLLVAVVVWVLLPNRLARMDLNCWQQGNYVINT